MNTKSVFFRLAKVWLTFSNKYNGLEQGVYDTEMKNSYEIYKK